MISYQEETANNEKSSDSFVWRWYSNERELKRKAMFEAVYDSEEGMGWFMLKGILVRQFQ